MLVDGSAPAWVCQTARSKIPQRAFSFTFVPLGRHRGLIFRIYFSCYIVPGWMDQLVLMSLWVSCQRSTCAFLAPPTILLLKNMCQWSGGGLEKQTWMIPQKVSLFSFNYEIISFPLLFSDLGPWGCSNSPCLPASRHILWHISPRLSFSSAALLLLETGLLKANKRGFLIWLVTICNTQPCSLPSLQNWLRE